MGCNCCTLQLHTDQFSLLKQACKLFSNCFKSTPNKIFSFSPALPTTVAASFATPCPFPSAHTFPPFPLPGRRWFPVLLDIVATASILIDVTWVGEALGLQGGQEGGGLGSQAAVVTSKAGRIIRLVRVIR